MMGRLQISNHCCVIFVSSVNNQLEWNQAWSRREEENFLDRWYNHQSTSLGESKISILRRLANIGLDTRNGWRYGVGRRLATWKSRKWRRAIRLHSLRKSTLKKTIINRFWRWIKVKICRRYCFLILSSFWTKVRHSGPKWCVTGCYGKY